MDKKFLVSWEELHRNARALAWRLVDTAQYKGIIAVTRGGMVPAAIVARELNIRKIDTISVITYTDSNKLAEPVIIKNLTETTDGEGYLVIDDLVDSGTTFKLLRGILPKAHFATIYAKPDGKKMVDTYIAEYSQDTWIYFPWDVELEYAVPVIDKNKK